MNSGILYDAFAALAILSAIDDRVCLILHMSTINANHRKSHLRDFVDVHSEPRQFHGIRETDPHLAAAPDSSDRLRLIPEMVGFSLDESLLPRKITSSAQNRLSYPNYRRQNKSQATAHCPELNDMRPGKRPRHMDMMLNSH